MEKISGGGNFIVLLVLSLYERCRRYVLWVDALSSAAAVAYSIQFWFSFFAQILLIK